MKTKYAALSMALIAAFAQAQDGAGTATIAIESLKSQRAQCGLLKDVSARVRCLESVADLALRLLEASASSKPIAVAQPTPAKLPQDPLAELVASGLEELTKGFKDSTSAKYRFVSLNGSQRPEVLCGEVSGKNSYGAYVGFKRFFVFLPAVHSEIEDSKTDVVARVWMNYCAPKLADVEIASSGEVSVMRLSPPHQIPTAASATPTMGDIAPQARR